MTDPTTPTTFPVAKSLLARLERYAPPDEYGGWHEWLDAVIEEARDGYVPASLSPEWHAELNLVEAEAATSALSALLWEVNQLPTVPGDYTEVVGRTGRGPFVSLPTLREAISDRLAKAEPEGESHDPDYMCPNCVTPWKCNGPHIPEGEPRG